MRKKIFLIIAIIIVFAIGYGFYLYYKPRADITNIKASVNITATDFYSQYQSNETSADKKYLDKIIEVKGIVADVQQTDSSLSVELKATDSGGINCSITYNKSEKPIAPEKGTSITIKGRCSGFLMDVNLVDCVIEN